MKALIEACRQFLKHGVSDVSILDTLKDCLGQDLPTTMESAKRTQLQTALLNVIQKCKNLIADISPDEAEDLEVYKELTGLVCISCEMLQTSDLLSRPGQDEDLVILTQLLFHFIKDSIKKNFISDLLEVVITLQNIFRDRLSRPGFLDTGDPIEKNFLAICSSTYALIYNWGCKALETADHTSYWDVFLLILSSVPFKSFTLPHISATSGGSSWTDRLCWVIKKAKNKGDSGFPFTALYQEVMTTLSRCRNFSLDHLLTVNAELVVSLTGSDDHLDGQKLNQTLARGLEFLDSQKFFHPISQQIVAVMEAQWLFSGLHDDFRTASRAVLALTQKNDEIRRLLRLKQAKGDSIKGKKLNFDSYGDIKEEEPLMTGSLVPDALSLKDEEKIMQPLFRCLKTMEEAFGDWEDPAGDVNRIRVGEEAASFLLELAQRFQLHRLYFFSLKSAQLAWRIVMGFSSDRALVLEVASIYMLTLRTLNLYKRASFVYQMTREIAEECREGFLLEYGQWVAEAGWVLLLSQQKLKGSHPHICSARKHKGACDGSFGECSWMQSEAAFALLKTLKAIVDESGGLNEFAGPLLKAQYGRLVAHFFLVEPQLVLSIAESQPTLSNPESRRLRSTISPLSLLEKAKTDAFQCLTQRNLTDSLPQQYAAKGLYLLLCQDLTNFLLRIGAPGEAFAFATHGQTFAKRELSCRWNLVFLSLIAHCRQNHGRKCEFFSSLIELNQLLSNGNPSILGSILQSSEAKTAKDPRNVDVEGLAAATAKMTLNLREAEADTEGEMSDCPYRAVRLGCISHGEWCQCADCLDFDLHSSFMESILLAWRSDLKSETKSVVFGDWLQHYEELKLKGRAVLKLLKTAGGVDAEVAEKVVPALFTATMLKIRLRNVANKFQSFASSDGALRKLTKRLEDYSEFQITHPDVVQYARYLEALDCLIMDTKNVKNFSKLVALQWSVTGGALCDFQGTGKGAVIEDRLTAMFPATPQRPLARPVTPENGSSAGNKCKGNAPRKGKDQAPEKKRTRRVLPKLTEGEEPAIPADMQEEVSDQPKRLAKRRDTMLMEFKENMDALEEEDVRHLAETSFAQPGVVSPTQSDNFRKAVAILEECLDSMAAFPLYPYQRMAATLLMLLTGDRDDPEKEEKVQLKLARLSAACTTGKLQHLSLMYYSRMIPNCDSTFQAEVADRAQHLEFSCDASQLKTDLLPRGWIVCSISCMTQLTLPIWAPGKPKFFYIMITRWENGVEPITLQVPVADRDQNPMSTLKCLADILERANRNQTEYANPRDYWTKRMHLNFELMDLAATMDKILGYAKALLLSPLVDDKDKNMKKNSDSLKALAKRHGVEIADNILQILVMAGAMMSAEQLIPLTSSLLKKPERSALVVSLVTAMAKFVLEIASSKQAPLILVLDNDMYGLPWESIPSLRNQPVSRLPSIQFVNMHLMQHQRHEQLKRDKVFYIVNPDADLLKTETHFNDMMGRFRLDKSWHGVKGSAPSLDQLKSAFEDHELILYSGHGSGSHVFNVSFFDSRVTSASMFLVGCSSVRLESSISMDSSGFLHQCLMMGSPFVTGNLWSVTSTCIDNFMTAVLEAILQKKAADKGDCFLRLFATSRDTIRSNYLVGAAPVIIGLPVIY